MPLRARWTSNVAVSGGLTTPGDGIKAIPAGADAVQLVSALLRHGPAYIGTIQRGLIEWMEREQLASLDDVQGEAEPRTGARPVGLGARPVHPYASELAHLIAPRRAAATTTLPRGPR
jgi:hypothetical protein